MRQKWLKKGKLPFNKVLIFSFSAVQRLARSGCQITTLQYVHIMNILYFICIYVYIAKNKSPGPLFKDVKSQGLL
jgi:hypothetical protein